MIIIAILIFLILSAFFSGSEIAFVSASKLGIELKKNKGSKRAKIISSLYDNPKNFISAMLIGNNIALVVFTTCMGIVLQPLIVQITGDGFGLLIANTIIITLIVLIFGEFLPKTFSRFYASDMLYFFAYPLSFFKSLLYLPTKFTNAFSNLILKHVLRAPPEKVEHAISKVDLEYYIEDTIKEGNDDIDKEIFTNVLKLNQLKVRDCMVPRTEIVYADQKITIPELINLFKNSRHSRIVIVDDDIEEVLGYIHHQQLIDNPQSIAKMILPIEYIPEAMNAQDLMFKFMKSDANLSCVVDEFGGTAGIITLEDLVEEIFGEIEDEHDKEDYIDIQISDDEYIFSGRLEIDYLNEKYENLNFPDGEYNTLSGYVIMTSGNIPEQGNVIELDDFRFTFESVTDTRIETIRVVVIPKIVEESPL